MDDEWRRTIALRPSVHYPGCMKSKTRNIANEFPRNDFKAMLLKLGDFWDDDFQAIMDQIEAERRTMPARSGPDFADEVLAEVTPKKRAKRRRKK
ncbi:MAG: hypothetical protein ACKO1J_11080 [Tagaea sp.]